MTRGGDNGPLYFVGRRRPHPALVAYRWRYEATALSVIVGGWVEFGPLWASAVGGAIAGLAALSVWPGPRAHIIRLLQHVIVQHRLRAGLLQTGLANRDGAQPRIMRTQTRGDIVTVWLWLPAGVAPEDVVAAAPRLAAACGAAKVHAVSSSPSRDRLRLIVLRPRWGVLGR